MHGFGCGWERLSQLDARNILSFRVLSSDRRVVFSPASVALFWTSLRRNLFRYLLNLTPHFTAPSNMRALPSTPVRDKRRGRGGQTACTECRNRKQKVAETISSAFTLLTNFSEQCEVKQGGPCNHCSRRYPPVECVFRSGQALSNPAGAVSPKIVNTSVIATSVKDSASNSKRLATSGTPPSNGSLPFSTDDLLPKLIVSKQQDSGLVTVGGLVTNLGNRVANEVYLAQGHQSLPPSEVGDSLCLIPQQRIDVQPHLPTLANPMPFGTTSFGGAILADTGRGGPLPERVAQLLHFCTHSKHWSLTID